MNLKERIRELAKERGLSLPNLESTLGLGNGTIIKWDKSTPNTDKIVKVADYFDVSVDYLLGRSENILDDDMRRINQVRRLMSTDDKIKMMKILEASFNEYFLKLGDK